MAGSNCASAGGSITLPSTTSVVPVALQQLRLQLNLRTVPSRQEGSSLLWHFRGCGGDVADHGDDGPLVRIHDDVRGDDGDVAVHGDVDWVFLLLLDFDVLTDGGCTGSSGLDCRVGCDW